MEEFLVVSALSILENCAQISSIVEILWQLRADQSILVYTMSSLPQVCILALILGGLLSVSVDTAITCGNEQTVLLMSKKIVDAVNDASLSTNIGYMSCTAEELIVGANGLALNEINAMHFLKNDSMLHSFLSYVKGNKINDKLKVAIVRFMWTLATTHPFLKEQLLTGVEIMQEVLHDDMPLAKCTLLKIEGWNLHEGML